MLKGEAKTAYMREYMRRRRAGLATAKPKPPWRPSPRRIHTVRRWQRLARNGSSYLPHHASKIIDGLDLDTDEGMAEACRRYQAHLDAQREEKEREKEREATAKKPKCWFCSEPASSHRILIGDGFLCICEMCVAEAARIIADKRK